MRLAAFLDRLPETRRPALWLVALCLLLWLPGFFTIPQGDRDESRFAQATRQMVETGDYVRIRLGDVERNKKPAGIHWAQAAVVHGLEAVGVPARGSIWAYRIPSMLGGIIAVLATFFLGRAWSGEGRPSSRQRCWRPAWCWWWKPTSPRRMRRCSPPSPSRWG